MSKTVNVGQPLFNNIEGHPFILGPQGPYRTKEEAKQALIDFYEGIDEIPNGQECIIAGVKFIWRGDDLYESLAVKTINENLTDLNFYRTPGTYRFNSIRNNNFANLPINNNNSNASITGELVVYSSVEGLNTYRSIIGQVLFLSNAEGHETKIYTRSANKTSHDGGVTYEVTWGDWQVCQGMKEVGLVSSYDSFIDNGMYSGIYNNNGILETFVIITINDYVVKSQFNQPKSVSQLKYALNAITNKSELSIRVGGGQTFAWDDWKPIFDAESITTQITDIQNQLNTLTEGTTGNINDIVNKAVNNIVGGAPEAYDTLKEIVDYINKNKDEVTGQVTDIVTSINELQNLKVIDLGSNLRPDQATNNIIAHVRDNNIKHAILFKYIDLDNSSTLGVCISRMGTSGWLIYLIARKGLERLQFNSRGVREAWNEYGGILRHNQNNIVDGQLETMSVNGLKSLIVDNLTANESLSSTRKILSILSANQGRVLNERINNLQNSKADNKTITDLQQEVNTLEKTKAPKSGYAPDLKVSYAEELVGRGEATPEVIGAIRPTGGEQTSIKDGNATIEKIKGKSVVWNQHLPYDVTKWGCRYGHTKSFEGGILSSTGSNPYLQCLFNNIEGHQLLFITEYRVDGSSFGVYNYGTSTLYGTDKANDGEWSSYKNIITAKKTEGIAFTSNGAYIELRNFLLVDLTQMFGAGKEPKTIEDFEARKPLGVSNEYNEGTIVSYNADALKSVGFNAFDGSKAKVVGGQAYYLGGTYTSIGFTKEVDGELTSITIPSDKIYTPSEDGYIYAQGTNICINLSHSGYRNGDYEPYIEDKHSLPNVKSIKDSNGNILFPYGLLSAGSVHDEITATKAIKRVGVVDMGDLNWVLHTNEYFQTSLSSVSNIKYMYTDGQHDSQNAISSKYGQANWINFASKVEDTVSIGASALFVIDTSYTTAADFKQAMSGVLLYYELKIPIEVDLPEPLNMTYEAWDFGTEELIAEGATTPLNADIIYQFNAVDRIRENTTKNKDLEARIAALEAMITQLTTQTTNEEEIEDEQM